MKQNRFSVIFLYLIFCSLFFMGITSCHSDKAGSEMQKLQEERDSIQNIALKSQEQIEDLQTYFNSISECLDSISEQEEVLLLNINPETNQRYSKKEIRERLNRLSEILVRQRVKIKSLSDSLTNKNDTVSIKGLSKMVKFLTSQLEEKEAQIQILNKELSDNKKSIANLKASINTLNSELSSVKEQNENLISAVVEQTKEINEGYILIADKKKLQQLGVLSKGGIFKKAKFDANNINLSHCQSVDISTATQIPLKSKNPKILTANPSSSYSIVDNGNIKLLVIKNPNQFWSLSNILVIQL